MPPPPRKPVPPAAPKSPSAPKPPRQPAASPKAPQQRRQPSVVKPPRIVSTPIAGGGHRIDNYENGKLIKSRVLRPARNPQGDGISKKYTLDTYKFANGLSKAHEKTFLKGGPSTTSRGDRNFQVAHGYRYYSHDTRGVYYDSTVNGRKYNSGFKANHPIEKIPPKGQAEKALKLGGWQGKYRRSR